MIVHIDCEQRAYKERGQVGREDLLSRVAWDDKHVVSPLSISVYISLCLVNPVPWTIIVLTPRLWSSIDTFLLYRLKNTLN